MIDFDTFIYQEMGVTKEDIMPLYKIYLTEMDQMIAALEEAVENSDAAGYERVLHNVKGICSNLRLDLITGPVSEMYSTLKSGMPLDLAASLQTLKELLVQIRKEINTYFNSSF